MSNVLVVTALVVSLASACGSDSTPIVVDASAYPSTSPPGNTGTDEQFCQAMEPFAARSIRVSHEPLTGEHAIQAFENAAALAPEEIASQMADLLASKSGEEELSEPEQEQFDSLNDEVGKWVEANCGLQLPYVN